ncbi:PAAR domain-containing protein [Morganella morganii]|uniref:PAAR domain-containing protein n=1 Tax=Morganella morganii TaxID=582 RepID=UPI0021CF3B1A|nr:PAAR domain-containing protein [Morganella morganii]
MSGYRPNIFGKAMAIDGDKTTTGATCIASSSMIKYKGTPAVIVGDLTTPCPQCKQTGTIATGDSRMMNNRKPQAVDGSIVQCGCPYGTNTVIAATSPAESQGFGSVVSQGISAVTSGMSAAMRNVASWQEHIPPQYINNAPQDNERIIHIAFFFDGVGRNAAQDAPQGRLSNIARLFRAYPTQDDDTLTKNCRSFYIPGIGTPFDETAAEKIQGFIDNTLGAFGDEMKSKPGDIGKDAFQSSVNGVSGKDILTQTKNTLLTPKGVYGELKSSAVSSLKKAGIEATPLLRDSEFIAYTELTGADTRLNSAKMRFVQSFEDALKNGTVPVASISVSVFGFDLGGALAREFLDILLGDICENNDDSGPTYRNIPVKIAFAGLFDCSRDSPLSSDNGLNYAAAAVAWLPGPLAKVVGAVGSGFGRHYLEHMSPLPEVVSHSLHLVAAHERRRWKCVYRTGRNTDEHQEILMPGCSEDIGGGLKPGEQKPSAELSRVSLRKMYETARQADVPFPELEKLYEKDVLVWSYFSMNDRVNDKPVKEWAEHYQMKVGMEKLSYNAMNRHLDGYFEWLGKQFYEYKSELRRLEKQESDILTSAGSLQGLGYTREAKQSRADILGAISLLKKHWGWLSEVSIAADVLLTQQYHLPPQIYRDNLIVPAENRARKFKQYGTAGYDGKPMPAAQCPDTPEIYAWFLHDVQRSEGINNGYFAIRWMEPRNS